MRVTIEHREGEPAAGNTERAYYLDCSTDFSEEEKAIIARRGLRDHYVTMPSGYPAVFDPAEQRRLYSLKLACAAGGALLCIVLTVFTGGAEFVGVFLGLCAYAVYCLYRYLKPKFELHERLTLGDLIKHRKFILAAPNPTRSKEVEDSLLAVISQMKQFLAESADVAPRSVHEF